MATCVECEALLQPALTAFDEEIRTLHATANASARTLAAAGEYVPPLPVCPVCEQCSAASAPASGSTNGARRGRMLPMDATPAPPATVVDLHATRRRTQASVISGIQTTLTCLPRDTFTLLTFENADLVRSNLGGQGASLERGCDNSTRGSLNATRGDP